MTLMNEAQLREQLARFSRRIWEQGWVANHDGNLSLRLGQNDRSAYSRAGGRPESIRLLCTPTALSKADLTPEMMLVVDQSGKVLKGKLRPFSELNLHWTFYQRRPDVGAVIHSHAPTATGFGAAGVGLERPFLPEAVVSLGLEVPLVPLSLPGHEAALALNPFVDRYDALLLAGNGVLTCGVDLEQAYLRMELVEHLCRIALVARQLGGPQCLPADLLPGLLCARTRAGLGPEARKGTTVSPARGDAVVEQSQNASLTQLVRDEIARVLK